MKARTASATSWTAIAESSRPAIRVTSRTPLSRISRRIGSGEAHRGPQAEVHQHHAERDRGEVREVVTSREKTIVATIAPGPASSGVPSGTRATFVPTAAVGSCSLPVSSSSATSRSSRPPAHCSGGQRDVQVAEDLLAEEREHRDHAERHRDRLPGRLAGGARRAAGGQGQEDRDGADRVHDHEEGHEDLGQQHAVDQRAHADHLGRAPTRARPRPRGQVEQPVELLRRGGVAAELVVDLAGAVVVAGAGGDEVEVAGDAPQPVAGRGVVVLVVDLDAGQARPRPARPASPRRVLPAGRPHGWAITLTPPASVDEARSSRASGRRTGWRTPAGRGQVAGERLGPVADDAEVDQGVGHVRAPGRDRVAGHAAHVVGVDRRRPSSRSRSIIAGQPGAAALEDRGRARRRAAGYDGSGR